MRRSRTWSTSDEIYEQVSEEAASQGISISNLVNQAVREHLSKQEAPVSSFSTADAEDDPFYMVKKFYTYSEDKKGHSTVVRVTLPKNIAGQLSRIVNSGHIPELRTLNDAIRNAVFHFSRQLALWIDDGELKSEVDLQMMIAEEELIRQQRRDAEEFIGVVSSNIDDAFRRRDYHFIRNYVKSRKERASALPESYRRPFEEMLEAAEERLEREEGKPASRVSLLR